MLAAANGRVRVVDYLLAAGASVEARPYRSTTGLHLAVQFRKAEMVGHPIARGAASTSSTTSARCVPASQGDRAPLETRPAVASGLEHGRSWLVGCRYGGRD